MRRKKAEKTWFKGKYEPLTGRITLKEILEATEKVFADPPKEVTPMEWDSPIGMKISIKAEPKRRRCKRDKK